MAFAIAAVIAALGGAVIYAATGQSSSQFMGPPGQHAAGPGGPGGPGGVGGPPAGGFGPAGPTARDGHDGPPVHGQIVVADGAGGYVTVVSQTGTVTAVTADSVTVRSEDGFTQNWTLTADQAAAFGVDDSVMVRGEQTATAPTPHITQVIDPLSTPR